jgi:serine/threonine protein kinase/Tol biopolymer transport system component
MGEVYRATDTRLNRIVAIKILSPHLSDDPEYRARFEREARAVSSQTHPRICALYDVGRQRTAGIDVDFLVMEFVEGDTLEQRIMAGPLPLDLALRYAIEIAEALDHMHRRGFVHRDLKPANIMITPSGAKLLDFGVAKHAPNGLLIGSSSSGGTGTRTLTDEGRIVGTLHYMAPEQLEGRAADGRCDVFALGAVIFEMIAGRKAFDGGSQASVVAAVLTSDPPSVAAAQPLAPQALERAVRKCLAKNPDDRWQTARDLASELEWIRDSREGGEVATEDRRGRSRLWAFAAIAAGGLLTVAFAVWSTTRPAVSRPTSGPIVFSIPAPDNAAFSECNQCLAVSPDGRTLVFVAAAAGAPRTLWVRSLDAQTTRSLAGTEGALGPFWSPDSQTIGFYANGKIKRIDALGRNLQTIGDSLDLGGLQGATWSRDGLILFASLGRGGLFSIPASGGAAATLTTWTTEAAEVAHSWPQFLPDGRHFLFRIKSREPEHTGIFVGSVDSSERTRLVDADANPVQAGPGYVIYGVDGTLWARRFDLSALRFAGEPVVIAQQIMFNTSSGRSAFAASDTVLAFRQIANTELRWFDRNGKELGVTGAPGRYLDPVLSPDGRRLAVARIDADLGTSHIWVFDTVRGSGSPLTSGHTWDRSPVWSPDGHLVGFGSKRTTFFDIYQRSSIIAAGDERLLGHHGLPIAWSPDGHFLLYQTGITGWDTVSAAPLGGESAAAVADFVGLQGQLSPDGRWIAYVSNEAGNSEVYVRRLQGGAPTRISVSGGVEPRWRRDGRELFFLASDRQLMAVDVDGRSLQFSADAPHALFMTRAQASTAFIVGRNEYDVAPDGQRFLFNVPVEGASAPITVVVNWRAALKER